MTEALSWSGKRVHSDALFARARACAIHRPVIYFVACHRAWTTLSLCFILTPYFRAHGPPQCTVQAHSPPRTPCVWQRSR